ncbi:MAG: hypothetical protein KDG89_11910 [Geminicoccaceae bacterium]|nr:hypothetical protein [Geminicoccaceae bacterium]
MSETRFGTLSLAGDPRPANDRERPGRRRADARTLDGQRLPPLYVCFAGAALWVIIIGVGRLVF